MNCKAIVVAWMIIWIMTGMGIVGAEPPSNGSNPCAGQDREIPPISYPGPLLKELGIDSSDIIKNLSPFENNPAHQDWLTHVEDVIPDICPGKKGAILRIHTSLLFLKDKLDNAFYSGKLNRQEFTVRLAGLMQWFQDANRVMLSTPEYNVLFGLSGDKTGGQGGKHMAGAPVFPIKNPATTVEMVKNAFDSATLETLNRFYLDQSQELRDITAIYKSGDFHGATQKQVKEDMQRIEKERDTAFMNYCRDKLSKNQFKLLFGSPKN